MIYHHWSGIFAGVAIKRKVGKRKKQKPDLSSARVLSWPGDPCFVLLVDGLPPRQFDDRKEAFAARDALLGIGR